MQLESLTAILAAVQACEAPDEDKQAAAQALTADFANSEDVPDDQAEAAMPAGMRAAYQATGEGAASPEQKQMMLADGAEIVRRNRAASLIDGAKTTVVKRAAGEPDPKTPLTVGNLAGILGPLMDKAIATSRVNRMGTLPVTQKTPAQNGQTGTHANPKVAKFAARVKSLEAGGTRKRGLAIQLAAEEDNEGFDAFHDAGRPFEK